MPIVTLNALSGVSIASFLDARALGSPTEMHFTAKPIDRIPRAEDSLTVSKLVLSENV